MAKATAKKTSTNKTTTKETVHKAPPVHEVASEDIRVGATLSKAWQLLDKSKTVWAQFALVIAIPTVLLSYFLGKMVNVDGLESLTMDPTTITKVAGGALVVSIVTSVYTLFVSALLVQAALKNAQGTNPKSLSHIFEANKDKLLVVALMMIIVFTLVGIGMFFLIVPGIIVAFLLGFSIFIIADTSLGFADAMKLSYQYASKHWMQMLFLALALFGISIVVSIVLALFSFLPNLAESLVRSTVQSGVQIFGVLAGAVLYLEIKKRLGSDPTKD